MILSRQSAEELMAI